MVTWWTEHAKHLGLTNGNNNLFGELYTSWLPIGCHCQCHSNGQSISCCNRELRNYLFRPISNLNCYPFCTRRNLLMVTRRTKHAKYYRESFIYYNLFGELYTSRLSICCYSQCNGNRQSPAERHCNNTCYCLWPDHRPAHHQCFRWYSTL